MENPCPKCVERIQAIVALQETVQETYECPECGSVFYKPHPRDDPDA